MNLAPFPDMQYLGMTSRSVFVTNMFSSAEALAEQLGYEYLSNEVSKYSEYYIKTFA